MCPSCETFYGERVTQCSGCKYPHAGRVSHVSFRSASDASRIPYPSSPNCFNHRAADKAVTVTFIVLRFFSL